jgi:organic hydroperoxide reductase OsmC/OhrA
MLFFLSLAAARGYVVDRYDDHAVGTLALDADGRMAMTRIVLNPVIVFGGDRQPDRAVLAELHHEAHARCYIANSLKGDIVVKGFEPCT